MKIEFTRKIPQKYRSANQVITIKIESQASIYVTDVEGYTSEKNVSLKKTKKKITIVVRKVVTRAHAAGQDYEGRKQKVLMCFWQKMNTTHKEKNAYMQN